MTSHSILLTFHIFMGALSIVSGFVAIGSRKGQAKHLKAGKTFLIAMLAMCSSGAALSIWGGITLSLLVSVFTIYLVATAWRASTRFTQTVTWGDAFGLVLVLSLSIGFFYHGHLASISPSGTIDNIPIGPIPYYVFGFISLFAGLRDLIFILNIKRTSKQARPAHIWRISLSLFIATSSFFTGNPQVFPKWFNDSFLSSLPEQFVLLAMVYYLFTHFSGFSVSKLINRKRVLVKIESF
ncbi:MAG: hypothetical protein MK188_08160 [Gammaproteobacteria bacterium]|nr:hypothetical protein [Gammaproteobacteria bacterium]